MKHELTQWKCFVADTPSFYDHIWIFKHKMTLLHSNCHWLCDITLSSNANQPIKSQGRGSFTKSVNSKSQIKF